MKIIAVAVALTLVISGVYYLTGPREKSWVANNKIAAKIIGVTLLLIAVLEIFVYVNFESKWVFFIPCVTLTIGCILDLNDPFFDGLICKEEIEAKCTSIACGERYAFFQKAGYPIFSYKFNGKEYTNYPNVLMSEDDLKDDFKVGETYTIKINRNDPDVCCLKKRYAPVNSISFMCAVMGILMCLGCYYVL